MADYSGWWLHSLYWKASLLTHELTLSHRHRYEQSELDYLGSLRRMRRLQKSFDYWLTKTVSRKVYIAYQA